MTVDILFPYYGDVELMKQAVRSVIGQSNPDWRLIVVDDGYPDESIPGWFASLNDERITYMRNEKNLGANGNYRKCLTFVENELVTVMGADDVMLPNYVQWLVDAAAAHPQASVFQPGVVVIDEHNAASNTLVEKTKAFYRPNHSTLLQGEDLALSLLRGNWFYFPSLGWRADADHPDRVPAGAERGAGYGAGARYCDERRRLFYDKTLAFMYRRHGGSDSSWRALEGTRFDEERTYFTTIAAELEALGWKKAAKAARIRFSSRAHALTLLPKAALAKKWRGVKNLAVHVVK